MSSISCTPAPRHLGIFQCDYSVVLSTVSWRWFTRPHGTPRGGGGQGGHEVAPAPVGGVLGSVWCSSRPCRSGARSGPRLCIHLQGLEWGGTLWSAPPTRRKKKRLFGAIAVRNLLLQDGAIATAYDPKTKITVLRFAFRRIQGTYRIQRSPYATCSCRTSPSRPSMIQRCAIHSFRRQCAETVD